MEDFEITPEVVTRCANEVQQYCKDKGHGGTTIHCLLRFVNPKTRKVDQSFSAQCIGAVSIPAARLDWSIMKNPSIDMSRHEKT